MRFNTVAGKDLRSIAIARTVSHIEQVELNGGPFRKRSMVGFINRASYLEDERRRLDQIRRLSSTQNTGVGS